MESVQIIGAGLAGLSAAITLAKENIRCNLISLQPSERAQSVLAEGGINAAINTMGEDDSPQFHLEDTVKAGVYLADREAVEGLTRRAPEVVEQLARRGVPFHCVDGRLQQRPFGGQRKRRTLYAKSSTGKALMTALIDEARKYEAAGLICRYPHHELVELLLEPSGRSAGAASTVCRGLRIRDTYRNQLLTLFGPVLLAFGGMNGIFPGMTTGTTANSGDAAAKVFAQGVIFGNLEMIQYHPTTVGISGKRCLISEAARGEGGRLFIYRNRQAAGEVTCPELPKEQAGIAGESASACRLSKMDESKSERKSRKRNRNQQVRDTLGEPWYFMEEKYPELGNLMPRDVVSREMFFALRREDCANQVYLDMRGLSREIWEKKLPDLREEIRHYLGIDPKQEAVPVEPGIHYFMGGIHVDVGHRTNLPGLYAAGECCCQYHGANRLGGNSLLGAIYGGMVAAESILGDEQARAAAENTLRDEESILRDEETRVPEGVLRDGEAVALESTLRDEGKAAAENIPGEGGLSEKQAEDVDAAWLLPASAALIKEIEEILLSALGIVRDGEEIAEALRRLARLKSGRLWNERESNRLALAEAMLLSAQQRRESRGAHYRKDYPELDEKQSRIIRSVMENGEVKVIDEQ